MQHLIYINGLIGKNEEHEIDGYTLEKFVEDLNSAPEKPTELIIFLNTIGGLSETAWQLYFCIQYLQSEHGMKVYIIALDDCKSSGTIVFCSVPVECRFVISTTAFMIHEVWTPEGGNARELREKADEVEQSTNEIVGLYVTETNLSEDQVKEMLAEETTLNADECVQYGFANDILDPETGREVLGDLVMEEMGEHFAKEKSTISVLLNASIEELRVVQERLDKGLGFYRREMPQIDLDVLPTFLEAVRASYGMDAVTEEKRELGSLKPAQREVKTMKVYEKMGMSAWKSRVYIVSKDGYLIDGHHDWAAGLIRYPSQQVNCLIINVKARELIDFANKLKITYKSTLMAMDKNEKKTWYNDLMNKFGIDTSKKATKLNIERGLQDGTGMLIIHSTGETPQEGDAVERKDGSELKDGPYVLADGTEIYVAAGKIAKAPAASSESEDEFAKLGLSVALNAEDKTKIKDMMNVMKQEVEKKNAEQLNLVNVAKKKAEADALAAKQAEEKAIDDAYQLAQLVESQDIKLKSATKFNVHHNKGTTTFDWDQIRKDVNEGTPKEDIEV